MAEIYRAVGSDKYDKIIISPEVQGTFQMGHSPIISKLVFVKLKSLKGWSKSYLDPENIKRNENDFSFNYSEAVFDMDRGLDK